MQTYQNTISELSARLIARHRLPDYLSFRMKNIKSGRNRRSDALIHRRAITKRSVPKAKGEDTVSDILREASDLFLEKKGFVLQLCDQSGSAIYGNTKIKNLRKLQVGLVADDDLNPTEQESHLEMQIEQISIEAADHIKQLEFLIDNPDEIVLPGIIKALIRRFSERETKEKLLECIRKG